MTQLTLSLKVLSKELNGKKSLFPVKFLHFVSGNVFKLESKTKTLILPLVEDT